MEIGISSLVFCNPEKRYTDDWNEIYQVVKNLNTIGYKFLEINTRSLPNSISAKSTHAKNLADLINSLQLEVHQIHISNNPGDIGSRDPKIRQEAINWIQESLDCCQVLKPKYLGIHPGGQIESSYSHTDWNSILQYTIESTHTLARFVRERGVKLMLETLQFDVSQLNRIIDSLSGEKVGILVDVAHCVCYLKQDPAEVIKEAGSRLYSLHMHDNHGERDEHLIPGEGIINWRKVLKALADVKYRGIFMMECHHSKKSDDHKTIAHLALEASKKLLAGQV